MAACGDRWSGLGNRTYLSGAGKTAICPAFSESLLRHLSRILNHFGSNVFCADRMSFHKTCPNMRLLEIASLQPPSLSVRTDLSLSLAPN
jgi:hypothetical protein